MDSIAKRITKARHALNITQKELAQKADVTEANLSRYENDKRKPQPAILKRLADALCVSTDYLLGIDNNEDSSTKDSNNDIETKLDEILDKPDGLMLCGEPLSEEDLILLRNSIRSTLELAKKLKKK